METLNFESTQFGSITVSNRKYPHDIYLLPNNEIVKRDKSHSKRIRGHKELSIWELEKVLQSNPRHFIIGTGQTGILPLSQETEAWLTSRVEQENIVLIRDRTPLVLEITNELLTKGETITGIFHTTC